MSFPGDVTFVQLTGTWLDGFGQPVNTDPTVGPISYIVVSPVLPTRLSDYASNTAIMPQRQVVNLTTGGTVPNGTEVIAVDCPALAGLSGAWYAVSVLLWDSKGAQLSPYSCVITPTTGSTPIDLSAPQYSVIGNSVGVPAM